MVRVLERETGEVRFELQPYESSFRGGVRVAIGDVTGDGQDDIIVSPGPGRLPTVRVYNGETGNLVRSFNGGSLPFVSGPWLASHVRPTSVPTYRGGVTVATGDLNGDGRPEIVTANDVGTGHIAIFSPMGVRVGGFNAGLGVRVAIGDTDGDTRGEIIVGATTGANVRVFDGRTYARELSFTAFEDETAGVYVGCGDVNGDGCAEVIVGAGSNGLVTIRDGRTAEEMNSIDASIESDAGVRVSGALISEDGMADIMVGSGAGSEWSSFDGEALPLDSGLVDDFETGVWVACSPEDKAINRHATLVVTEWNASALDAIRSIRTPPPVASRALAILQTAVYDAINGIVRAGKKYLVTPAGARTASIPAAASQAAHDVLTSLFPAEAERFQDLLDTWLASIPGGQSKDDGVAWGATVATAILAARANDGASTAATTPYTPGTDPGDWQPTLPANAAALLPGWGNVRTFGAGNAATLVPSGPPRLTSAQWATELNQVKEIGSKTSTTRTADQTEIANFWADGGGTFTPPGHWNAITAQLVEDEGLSLFQTARLFARLDIALADAAIVSWRTKYAYNFWRPITAIRNADTDGNASTIADPTWEPLIATPPFPDYTSGHSTFSGAAADILGAQFGANYAFDTQSDTGSLTRSFTSFRQAADEAGMSRIYGGIHYMKANVDGLTTGRRIAARVLANTI